MATLPIIEYPNPILLKKAEPISKLEKSSIEQIALNSLIADMFETMEKNSGVGLAAPQIGKSIRLCVVNVEDEAYVLINPRITYTSALKEICEEGCLSFPGKFIPVKRAKKVRVKAQNELGEEVTIKAKGLLARVLQHEIDHLDGLLFIEKEIKAKK